MLRYRATEIRLTSQDVDETSKRLAARRAAAKARSTICQIPGSTSTGPRLRRGPERSRDESITHPDAGHAPPYSAALVASSVGIARPSLTAEPGILERPGWRRRNSSRRANSSPADDISYTSEPELAGKSTPLEHVDQRVFKTTSQSPKKHSLPSANVRRPLLQYDGSSESKVPDPPSPETARNPQHARESAEVSGLQPQDPSVRLTVERTMLPRSSLHQSRAAGLLLQGETPGADEQSTGLAPRERYIATSTGTHRGLPVWFKAPEIMDHPRDSVIEGSFDMTQLDEALDNEIRPIEETVPSILLPSPTSTPSASEPDKKHHSLPALSNASPQKGLSRSPSVGQASEHSSLNFSRQSSLHLRTASTPDLLRPLLETPSAASSGGRYASGALSAGNSPTSSIAMLDLIRQKSSPLERLELETRSQISRAPSVRLTSAGAASSRSSSPALGELRMPTFESPERLSPHRRRAARYRNAPTFAEIPQAPISTSVDLLPSFEYSPPSLQPGAFIDRYPGSAGTGEGQRSTNEQGAAPMPSLPTPHPSRPRASGHGQPPIHVSRHTHLSSHHWPRGAGGGEGAAESRRNTLAAQQRPRRYRSISARLMPAWHDEQENSGHAERMAMMAEIQERRRYVEQTSDGVLDRTPPSLGRFESRLFPN